MAQCGFGTLSCQGVNSHLKQCLIMTIILIMILKSVGNRLRGVALYAQGRRPTLRILRSQDHSVWSLRSPHLSNPSRCDHLRDG